MNCFPCFTSQKSKRSNSRKEQSQAPQEQVITRTPDVVRKPKVEDANQVDTSNIQAQNFTFRELAVATKNFRQECLMGEGGFGRVYKGTVPATGQVIAVKQLDRNGMQGSKEFLVEVLMLSLLNHENLVKLTGYCADGDQRLLVYEFMPAGSLERRLLERKPDQAPLDWYNRMKIASSAAKGLWYLHDKANPPVIYRDLKSSNILLDNDLNGKLSDYGLAKLAGKDKMNIGPTRVMGTYGYSAPEYIRTGNLTLKSDVYSFGVVLLELITGRRAVDTTKPNEEQNLVSWAQPIFRDPKRYPDMADALLKGQFPEKDLNQVVAIAAMCLQEESAARPLMSDVVTALSFLSTTPPKEAPPPIPAAPAGESESESESDAKSGDDSSDKEASRHKQDNGTTQHQVAAASAKYNESDDASDNEYDYYENENKHKYSPQDNIETKEFYSKSSRKSSTRSRNETDPSSGRGSRANSDSEEVEMVSSGPNGSTKQLSQKSSKKTSLKNRDLSQKSSKKSSLKNRDLSQKSSKKKSCVKVLSNKRSMGVDSEEGSVSSQGNALLSRNNSSSSSSEEDSRNGGAAMYEHGSSVSFGLIGSESDRSGHDNNYSFQNGSSRKFDHNSSRGSDIHHFDHASMVSSSSEDEGSYRHLNP